MKRRDFLSLLASASAAYPLSALANLKQQSLDIKSLSEPWKTIAAVQEHLFPAEKDSPGAYDIHAIVYLQNMLNRPGADQEEVQFIKDGQGWLNGMANKLHQEDFLNLSTKQKENVLRKIENSRAGYRWLDKQLEYILEALLSDPVYGGNHNGIGWEWLAHQPGFPAPTGKNLFYKLGYQVHRNTKA